MLGGNVLTPQVTINGAVADSVFQIGQNGTLRNLTIGWYASGSGELALSGGMFVAYLDEISVAYNTVNSGTSVIGVFDLRDTTYHSNTFEANTIRVGVGRYCHRDAPPRRRGRRDHGGKGQHYTTLGQWHIWH